MGIRHISQTILPGTALGFVLCLPSLAAGDPSQQAHSSLARSVKSGDLVSVTRWSGGKARGQVLAVSAGSLSLRTATGTLDLPEAAIKTVRRHQPRKPSAAAGVVLEIASICDEAACVPAALAYVGVAAVIQGIGDLTRPSKVVYRAPRRAQSRVSAPHQAGDR
jgi:hypothetical protein